MSTLVHEDILVQEVNNPQDYLWTTYDSGRPYEFDSWEDAYEVFFDQVKYWYGYYGSELVDAGKRGLSWSTKVYEDYCDQYEGWVEFLATIEDEPQQVNLLGGNRKLSITARKKNDDA